MESYKQILLDEIPEFRAKGHKFLNKEMSKWTLNTHLVEWVFMRTVMENTL